MSDKEPFISEKNIIIGLDASSKEEAILQMSQALEKMVMSKMQINFTEMFYKEKV